MNKFLSWKTITEGLSLFTQELWITCTWRQKWQRTWSESFWRLIMRKRKLYLSKYLQLKQLNCTDVMRKMSITNRDRYKISYNLQKGKLMNCEDFDLYLILFDWLFESIKILFVCLAIKGKLIIKTKIFHYWYFIHTLINSIIPKSYLPG